MKQKFLYIVDHYLKFPHSEYGGIWNVIAENNEECFDLITSRDVENHYEQDYRFLRENIDEARRFILSDANLESQIVEEFVT